MRAVYITSATGPDGLRVRESPDPEPGPGQVRVRVHAAGLNFAEVIAAQGLYPDAPKRPCVVGYEVAGGGHSDVVCVPVEQVIEIPEGKEFAAAAALPVNYLTAYHMLFRVACVRPGERVLVHMAAGGVGTAVLRLCRTMPGLEVFGTASAAKHERLRRTAARTPSTTGPPTTRPRSAG